MLLYFTFPFTDFIIIYVNIINKMEQISNFRNKNIVIVCHSEYGNRTREFKVGYYRDPIHLLNNIHNWTTGKAFTVVDVENTDHLTDKEHKQLCELDFEPLYK